MNKNYLQLLLHQYYAVSLKTLIERLLGLAIRRPRAMEAIALSRDWGIRATHLQIKAKDIEKQLYLSAWKRNEKKEFAKAVVGHLESV